MSLKIPVRKTSSKSISTRKNELCNVSIACLNTPIKSISKGKIFYNAQYIFLKMIGSIMASITTMPIKCSKLNIQTSSIYPLFKGSLFRPGHFFRPNFFIKLLLGQQPQSNRRFFQSRVFLIRFFSYFRSIIVTNMWVKRGYQHK